MVYTNNKLKNIQFSNTCRYTIRTLYNDTTLKQISKAPMHFQFDTVWLIENVKLRNVSRM